MSSYEASDTTATVDDDAYVTMRKLYKAADEADSTQRRKWLDDLKLTWVAGSGWDSEFGKLRGDLPKLEVNNLRQAVKQVVNDIRQNTPAIKVRAAEGGDVDLAEIRQGLIRNIESRSNADTVYDWAAMYAVSGGYGVWRVNRDYVDDNGFDQDIVIQRVHNPMTVKFDPNASELDRSDASYAFVDEQISITEYKRRYPGKEPVNFRTATDTLASWCSEKKVRLAEYWKRESVVAERLLLSDGRIVDGKDFDETGAANPQPDPKTGQVAEPVTIKARRNVETWKVTSEIVDGEKTLEGPFDWPGKWIPLVPVWGDFIHIEGEDEWYGMARHSRDAVVLNNYALSTAVELLAMQPNAPMLYSPKHVAGFEREWRNAAKTNSFGLPVNVDPEFPGGLPKREMPPQISQGHLTLMQVSSDAVKSTTGLFNPSLGQVSNETSGKAIIARQREGDVANFDYTDNIHRAIRFTGEIVNDLIPHVYDANRTIRILGEDGASDFVKINEPVWNGKEYEIRNDMRQGRYDITISTGPSYTTQRMETLEACMQLAQSGGPLSGLAMYGVLTNMDTPGMDDIRDGMRKMLVGQGLLEPDKEDGPPPGPPPPNPKDVADAKLKDAQAKLADANAEQTITETQRMIAMDQFALGPTPIPTEVPGMPPVPPPQPMQPDQPPNGGFYGQ